MLAAALPMASSGDCELVSLEVEPFEVACLRFIESGWVRLQPSR